MRYLKKGLALILAILVMMLSFPTVGFGASSVNPVETAEDSADQKNDSETEDQKEEAENIQAETVNSESEIDESDINIPETSSEERSVIEQDIAFEPDDQFEEEPSDEKTEEATGKENETDNNENKIDVINEEGLKEAEKSESAEEKGVKDETEEPSEEADPVTSMQPLTTVTAYLNLNSKTDEELKNMPLDTILSSLMDSNGDFISLPTDADSVWRYVKDKQDGIDKYEKYSIGNGETIDLSVDKNVLNYQLELIVGSGNQLNPDNIRYNITVYVSDHISEEFTFELYNQPDDNTRIKVEPRKQNFYIQDFDEDVWTYFFTLEPGDYYLYIGATSEFSVRPDGEIKIYDAQQYLFNKQVGIDIFPDITDQLLGQDMSNLNAGYLMTSDYKEFVAEYYIDNELVTTLLISVKISCTKSVDITGKLSSVDGEDILLLQEPLTEADSDENDSVKKVTYKYRLKEGYSEEDEYLLSLNALLTPGGDNINSAIIKAVEGTFDSLEEAANATDISANLFSDNGYKEAFGREGKTFTIFLDDKVSDGTHEYRFADDAIQLTIILLSYDEVSKVYTGGPIVGSEDPWFRVVGAESTDGNPLPTYIVENGKSINMDTMYGYGYQTILINDSSVTELVPVIEKEDGNKTKIDRIYVNGNEFNQGDSIQLNGLETTVTFNVVIVDENGEHTKNYNVSFIQKANGPRLFVADPKGEKDEDPVRSVFLDEYFEYKHDIFIANIGDQELTGLKVELDATNVKLDDYWTVGGDKGSSLPPLPSTDDLVSDTSELPNVAKIRLLPDGDGDIEGKLTIYADNQEPVVIKLSGRAQNPSITADQLEDAVKYVPYSYMITTNNMYDWNTVSFDYTGNLPPGMEFNKSTGEIYGAPLEAGIYTFTVTADYGTDYFEDSTKEFTINVLDNANQTVFDTSDNGYAIIPEEDGENGYVGEQVSAYDFVLTSLDEDEIFISEGTYDQFVKLWLNGEELTEGVDYTTEPGSTKITIKSQTLKDKSTDGRNTISAEFNVNNERGENLKRTSQNYRVDLASKDPTESTEPTDDPAEPTKPTDSSTPADSAASENSSAPTASTSPANPTTPSNTAAVPGSTSNTAISDSVNIITHVVGADGKALANYIVEMHSTVKTATTDASGNATFNAMEMGTHTVYIKNPDGTTVASKNFTLKAGSSLSKDGDIITVMPGQTMTMTIKVDGSNASIEDVKAVSTDSTSPKTGDTSHKYLWIILMMISVAALISLGVIRRKTSLRR